MDWFSFFVKTHQIFPPQLSVISSPNNLLYISICLRIPFIKRSPANVSLGLSLDYFKAIKKNYLKRECYRSQWCKLKSKSDSESRTRLMFWLEDSQTQRVNSPFVVLVKPSTACIKAILGNIGEGNMLYPVHWVKS